MDRLRYVAFGAVAGLLMAVPQTAEAQAADGWWSWALRDAAELANVRVQEPPRSGDKAREGGRTIGDIIFGRGGDKDGRSGEKGRRGEADRDRDEDRRETSRRGERGERSERGARRGPPFCSNGQGHPVHGLQWCRDKGFGDYGASARWEDRGWEDVILRQPRGTDRQGTLDQGGLIDVLGDVVFGRLDSERQRLGGSARLDGRWLHLSDGARVLQIRSGSVPVAELNDLDGDGRVDVTLIPQR